ncbi:MAG: exo-alpha-sialidase [Planctomycetota bacterium]|jgi:predicted neuraminidase
MKHLLQLTLTVFLFFELNSAYPQEPHFSSELVFPLRAEHNHAPSIVELADGSMLASWYRGSGERKADDVSIYGARLAKDTTAWSDDFMMTDTPGFPDGNTAMMVDSEGHLHLFWPLVLANTWESCVSQQLVSFNPSGTGCPKWDRKESLWLKPEDFSGQAITKLDALLPTIPKPLPENLQKHITEVRERLTDKLYQRLGWQTRCKPTVLDSGRILLPLYSDTYSFSLMAISDDHGLSWRASKPLMGFGNIQPTVLQKKDGTLVAYMRENGFTGKIRKATSSDQGESWSDVTSIELVNPGSGLDAVKLSNGNWVLIYNDTPQGRNQLAVALSRDEGSSWSSPKYLEKEKEGSFHYPAIIQGRDGRIHAIYSYFVLGGKSMKHAQFSESWIESP